MSEDKSEPKIGAGHASAMFRLGLAELRAAVAFSDSNVVQPSPYGIYGTKTPGEVQEERKSSSKDAGDEESSVVNERRMDADQEIGTDPPDRESIDIDRE